MRSERGEHERQLDTHDPRYDEIWDAIWHSRYRGTPGHPVQGSATELVRPALSSSAVGTNPICDTVTQVAGWYRPWLRAATAASSYGFGHRKAFRSTSLVCELCGQVFDAGQILAACYPQRREDGQEGGRRGPYVSAGSWTCPDCHVPLQVV